MTVDMQEAVRLARTDVYSGDELIGTVPTPHDPPTQTFFKMMVGERFNLGIQRTTFHDIAASIVEFEIKWHVHDNGWTKRIGLHCSPMYGPGDWECIPGFRNLGLDAPHGGEK